MAWMQLSISGNEEGEGKVAEKGWFCGWLVGFA